MPRDSSVPSMPLMVSRSACAKWYVPLMRRWRTAGRPPTDRTDPRPVTLPGRLGVGEPRVEADRAIEGRVGEHQVVDLERARRTIGLARLESPASRRRPQRVDDDRDGPCSARCSLDASRSARAAGLGPPLARFGRKISSRSSDTESHVDRLAQDRQHGHDDRETLDAHQRRQRRIGRLVVQHQPAPDHLHLAPEQHLQVRQLHAGAELLRTGSTQPRRARRGICQRYSTTDPIAHDGDQRGGDADHPPAAWTRHIGNATMRNANRAKSAVGNRQSASYCFIAVPQPASDVEVGRAVLAVHQARAADQAPAPA